MTALVVSTTRWRITKIARPPRTPSDTRSCPTGPARPPRTSNGPVLPCDRRSREREGGSRVVRHARRRRHALGDPSRSQAVRSSAGHVGFVRGCARASIRSEPRIGHRGARRYIHAPRPRRSCGCPVRARVCGRIQDGATMLPRYRPRARGRHAYAFSPVAAGILCLRSLTVEAAPRRAANLAGSHARHAAAGTLRLCHMARPGGRPRGARPRHRPRDATRRRAARGDWASSWQSTRSLKATKDRGSACQQKPPDRRNTPVLSCNKRRANGAGSGLTQSSAPRPRPRAARAGSDRRRASPSGRPPDSSAPDRRARARARGSSRLG